MSKKHGWDCIAVRSREGGKLVLTSPPVYGVMYDHFAAVEGGKVRPDIPRECGPVRGASKEDKMTVAIALAAAYNEGLLKKYRGLVLRGFVHGTPFATPDTWIVHSPGIGLRVKDTTGWLAYVSPECKFYTIVNRHMGAELPSEQSRRIRECIEVVRHSPEWSHQTRQD